jgi:hypothetical protein
MDPRESIDLYATFGIVPCHLTDKEKQFIESICRQIYAGRQLSDRQEQWLGNIQRKQIRGLNQY